MGRPPADPLAILYIVFFKKIKLFHPRFQKNHVHAQTPGYFLRSNPKNQNFSYFCDGTVKEGGLPCGLWGWGMGTEHLLWHETNSEKFSELL